MPTPPNQYPDKTCETCGKSFNRKRFNGRLEDPARYLSRRNCSQSCGNSKKEVTLKLHWREDREKRLAGVLRGVITRQQSTDTNSPSGA